MRPAVASRSSIAKANSNSNLADQQIQATAKQHRLSVGLKALLGAIRADDVAGLVVP